MPRLRGSSPRMRGALEILLAVLFIGGIIPADAGSTRPSCWEPTGPKDHPRGCGEHGVAHLPVVGEEGSSPRMRGALGLQLADCAGAGIIPADAGSTQKMAFDTMRNKDHPRGCGEHPGRRHGHGRATGSSPRMRGAPCGSLYRTCPTGIIPADAGSTFFDNRKFGSPRDHPRGCGEHSVAIRTSPLLRGSSPRMRGALSSGLLKTGLSGIIPADAGSTVTSLS